MAQSTPASDLPAEWMVRFLLASCWTGREGGVGPGYTVRDEIPGSLGARGLSRTRAARPAARGVRVSSRLAARQTFRLCILSIWQLLF
jgi:hypothetical protein